jgi:hypothetical protein
MKVRPPGERAQRVDRARRAFELALAGNTARRISEIMTEEGYRQVGASTAARLIKEFGESITTPLAKEHVTREYERLMAQRLRLEKQAERAWEIADRFHFATNNQGVIMVAVPGTEKREGGPELRPVRDSGPELQALKVLQGVEDLVLKNGDALARLLGIRPPEQTKVTITTEVDAAIADLVGEMNARDAAAARDVRA